MMGDELQAWQRMPQLSEKDFAEFAKLVTERLGIRMPRVKLLMVQSRLISRLQDLELTSFSDYLDYLLNSSNTEQELRHFYDLITTNKTDFYREGVHFDFLINKILPNHASGSLNVWSAGCSSGEEAYTIAIVLGDHSQCHPGFAYSILATDISQRSLKTAREAIYPENRIEPIPMVQRRRYLLRGKNTSSGLVRIGPELRARVSFKRLNLMDHSYALERCFEVIFFRNVMIYFDRETQMRVLTNICKYLRPGGHLFISLTESIIGGNLPLVQIAPSIFRKCE